jgi:exodeoxyribonuclease V beta subunit
VPAQDRLHELEFAFPEALEPPPPEVRRQEGFWVGVIDLVVRRGSQFFLFDWKTNLLQGAYTPAELAQNMKECEYDRQYRLYLHALGRWLRRVRGKAFDFERDFGGVYYLYLRGMNGRDETAGVFFARPTADDLRLERVLAR